MLRREKLDVVDAVHRIVKATLMRITMHAVDAADYPAFHEAIQTTLRAARLNDRRFTSEGISIEDVEALTPHMLEFAAQPQKNAEVEAWLEQRLGASKPRIWWALRHYGPFVHAATGGPWSFGPRPAYLAAPEQARPGDRAKSMQTLVRGYLEGFGPASAQDISQFGLVYRPLVRDALRSLGDDLQSFEGPDGAALFAVPGGALPSEDSPAPPRLLRMWDSVLLAYADRSRIVPPEYRRLIGRNNGDVLPTLLVDGFLAGSGGRSTAASRRRRSTGCLTRPGRAWRPRPARSWRSWPTANPRCTAAMPAGGPTSRTPRSACWKATRARLA